MVKTGEGCPSGAHTLPDADPLHVYALGWVMAKPGVACTVVEMERPDLVEDGLVALRRS